MPITLKEIAEKSGCGYGTVARALSDNPTLIKEETRKKILKIAKKYGYAKNLSAQALVSGKSKDIGLVIPARFVSPYYNDLYIKLVSGIIEALNETEYKLRVLFLRQKTGFDAIAEEVKGMKLAGLILAPYIREFFIAHSDIRKLNIPVVVLGRELKGEKIHSIILDDYKGGYDGTSYLINKGHRKIGVIRGFRKDIEERYAGYKQALADNGIKINKTFVRKGDALEKSGYLQAKKMLKLTNKPTAIFCLDDEMAWGALKAATELRINCPEKVSVIGFDGIEFSAHTNPPLTTMGRPVEEMGKIAADILINKREDKKGDILLVQAKTIERESCKRI